MAKHYSEETKTMAMKALLAGDSPQKLAEKTGISPRTLKYWKAQAKAASVHESAPQKAKKDVLELLSEGRLRYLEHAIAPEVVAKESGYYSTMAVAKLNEAHQLLTGGATQRIDGDFASWLRSQRTQAGTPRPLEAAPAVERVEDRAN